MAGGLAHSIYGVGRVFHGPGSTMSPAFTFTASIVAGFLLSSRLPSGLGHVERDRIPDFGRIVDAPVAMGRPSGLNATLKHAALVTADREGLATGRRIPELDGLVGAGRGDPRSIGAERDGHHVGCMTLEGEAELPGRRIEDLDFSRDSVARVAAGGDPPAGGVVREDSCPDATYEFGDEALEPESLHAAGRVQRFGLCYRSRLRRLAVHRACRRRRWTPPPMEPWKQMDDRPVSVSQNRTVPSLLVDASCRPSGRKAIP